MERLDKAIEKVRGEIFEMGKFMITKNEIIKHLDEVKRYLKEIENEVDWVEINNENCPTLAKYGAKPFKIMKRKMRKDGEVWNNINFYNAQKEAEKLGYRLPDMREMLALLEQYRTINKKRSSSDKEFLGIEELSDNEEVYYEWIDCAGVAALRGGAWGAGADVGPFTLLLNLAPSVVDMFVGFRCASNLVSEKKGKV